jgi:hypothetical protein
MQAEGLEWGEGYRPLGRQALAEVIEDQMGMAVDRPISTISRPTTHLTGATGTTRAIC